MSKAGAATAITVAVSEPPTTPVLPINGDTAGYLGAGTLISSLLIIWLRRRLSRDGLEVAKDRAEGGMLKASMAMNESLARDNERLMTVNQKLQDIANVAWSTRTDDAKRIAQLETTVIYMQRELDRLNPEVASHTRALVDSGVMPLIEHPKEN